MDLRDEFAVHAMNGFITGCCSQSTSAPISELSHSYMAQVAYQVADCMIEARKTSEDEVSPNSAEPKPEAGAQPCGEHNTTKAEILLIKEKLLTLMVDWHRYGNDERYRTVSECVAELSAVC